MTLREALQSATQTLRGAGIADALVEAELLLSHVLGVSRTWLYAEPERSLSRAETELLGHLMGRRLNREPAAYILGRCQFYGIEFYIDSRALIPRPETELLVEEALLVARGITREGGQIKIADIGTGCGAIAVSLALALPCARIYATDISAAALQLAEANCHCHGVEGRVELLQGNLIEPLPDNVDMVVANLPYVRDCDFVDLSPEIREYEPRIALSGGKDGLDKIREMLEQMRARWGNDVKCPMFLLLEIGQGQRRPLTSLINSYFPNVRLKSICDPGGIDRVLSVELQAERAGLKEQYGKRHRSSGSAYR